MTLAVLSITTEASNAAPPPHPQGASQLQRIIANDFAAGEDFGYSIAVDGDTLLIGAVSADVAGQVDQGVAYIFVRQGQSWVQQAKLSSSDGLAGDGFGVDVALQGDTALIGAFRQGDQDIGAAYLFHRSGDQWSEQAVFRPGDGLTGDSFGFSLALQGNTAVIGSPGHGPNLVTNPGAAYVYVEQQGAWSLQAKLVASSVSFDGFFGYSVDVDGDLAVIGAPTDDTIPGGTVFDQGSAFIFERQAGLWTERVKFIQADTSGGVQLGRSVSVWGERVLIGAPGQTVDGNGGQGAAVLYLRNNGVWQFETRLIGTNTQGFFGISVDLQRDLAIAGAFAETVDNNIEQGAAYTFANRGNGWTLTERLTANDGSARELFGVGVAIADDSSAFAGAHYDDEGSTLNSGSVYAFGPTVPADDVIFLDGFQ